MSYPLYSIPIVNSVVFGCNEGAKTLFKFDDENMTLLQGFLCGGIAGGCACIVVTPVEMIKCRLQIQYESKEKAQYKGSWDCLRQIVKKYGIRGLYTGNLITLLRDISGYSAQFGAYHFVKKYYSKLNGSNYNDLSLLQLMIAGGLAGNACWLVSYPQDTIKTLLQTSEGKFRNIRDGGIIDCSKYIYHRGGLYAFWVGFGICSVRAFYANAILYYIFENSLKYQKNKFFGENYNT
jgi:solute carrier family 25 carnitine/acylcarnitine transporter 20/29